jgi:four helix bundle protein
MSGYQSCTALSVAGVRRYRDLVAWQLSDAFKVEIFTALGKSLEGKCDLRFRSQLAGAASGVSKNIAEGFHRRSPAEFIRFLGYALGSLAEAEDRFEDGVLLGYFTDEQFAAVRTLAKRATPAIARLQASQRTYLATTKRTGSRDRQDPPEGSTPER